MAKEKNEVATTGTTQVNTAIPDYLRDSMGVGNENLTRQDVTIPRINIVQSLSPERAKADAKFIPGCEEGQFFNNVTREILPETFNFVDVFYNRTYGVFVHRDFGGGFKGQFATEAEAQIFVAAQENASQLEVVDTGVHVVVRVDDALLPVETCIIMFNKSKLKVSRNINTILKGKGTARFSTVWKMSSVAEKNQKNQPYFNFKAEDKGWAPKELFDYCKQVYEEVKDKDLSASVAAAEAKDGPQVEY